MTRKRLVLQTLIAAAACVSLYAAGQETRAYQVDPDHRVADAPPSARSFLLRGGTEVTLKFAQKLSGKSAFIGEPVELVLAQDLKVGDSVIVKQGARVLGTVVAGKESEKKR